MCLAASGRVLPLSGPSSIAIANNLRHALSEWRAAAYVVAFTNTRELLTHWFLRDHQIRNNGPELDVFHFDDGQREALEAFVYLSEVLKKRTLSEFTAEFSGANAELAAQGIRSEEDRWPKAVYVSGMDGSAWALDTATGKVIWQVVGSPGKTAYVGSAAPSIGDRAVVFPSSAGDLMAVLKIGGGTKVWQSSLAGKRLGRAYAMTYDVTGDAVIAGKTLYAGSGAGRTVALSASSGEKIWSATEGALGPVAVAGGSIFLVSDEARLVRLDAATGEMIWSVEMPYFTKEKVKKRKGIFAHYGPILAGGRVMVVSSDGLLRAFDPTNGSLTYTAEIPGGAAAQPAVAGGTLYVVGGNGQLHAFR